MLDEIDAIVVRERPWFQNDYAWAIVATWMIHAHALKTTKVVIPFPDGVSVVLVSQRGFPKPTIRARRLENVPSSRGSSWVSPKRFPMTVASIHSLLPPEKRMNSRLGWDDR
jgi:hypothetical protein